MANFGPECAMGMGPLTEAGFSGSKEVDYG